MFFDPFYRADKVETVAVMLGHTGRDSQHVRVEDDVLWRKPDFFGQQTVSAFTDFDFAFENVCLSLLVERHHNGCRP